MKNRHCHFISLFSCPSSSIPTLFTSLLSFFTFLCRYCMLFFEIHATPKWKIGIAILFLFLAALAALYPPCLLLSFHSSFYWGCLYRGSPHRSCLFKVYNTWILNTQTFSLIKCIELSVLSTLCIAHTKPALNTASSNFHHSGAGPEHNAASTSTFVISVQAAVLVHPQQGVLLQVTDGDKMLCTSHITCKSCGKRNISVLLQ